MPPRNRATVALAEVDHGVIEPMLRVTDAAAALKVNPTTIYRLIRAGRITPTNISTTGTRARYRIPASELARLTKEPLR